MGGEISHLDFHGGKMKRKFAVRENHGSESVCNIQLPVQAWKKVPPEKIATFVSAALTGDIRGKNFGKGKERDA